MSASSGGLGVEDVDEGGADGLALELGVADAGEALPRNSGPASTWISGMLKWPRNRSTTSLASPKRSRPVSTKTQVSWSPMASCRSRAVTAESTPPERPQMTPAVPTWARTLGDRLLAVGVHRPVAGEARDAEQEVLQEAGADRGVDHLGVELDAVEAAVLVGDGGEGRGVALGDDGEARRDGGDAVAVAHPDGRALARGEDALEQRRGAGRGGSRPGHTRGGWRARPGRRAGRTWSARRSRRRAPARRLEHGRRVRAGSRASWVEAGPPERMIAAGREARVTNSVADGAGVDLAVDPVLAHAARDQLGVLRAEVEDQDALGHRFGRWWRGGRVIGQKAGGVEAAWRALMGGSDQCRALPARPAPAAAAGSRPSRSSAPAGPRNCWVRSSGPGSPVAHGQWRRRHRTG